MKKKNRFASNGNYLKVFKFKRKKLNKNWLRYVESENEENKRIINIIPVILHLHFKRVNETCFNIQIYIQIYINIEPPKQKSKAMWRKAFAEYCIFFLFQVKARKEGKNKTEK